MLVGKPYHLWRRAWQATLAYIHLYMHWVGCCQVYNAASPSSLLAGLYFQRNYHRFADFSSFNFYIYPSELYTSSTRKTALAPPQRFRYSPPTRPALVRLHLLAHSWSHDSGDWEAASHQHCCYIRSSVDDFLTILKSQGACFQRLRTL